MPLYEYKCVKCGRRFEKIESVSAPETRKCPKCGGRAERQLTAPAIQFKGSGWYVTDYAGKNATGTSGDASGDGVAGKAAEKPTDSKSDSQADSKSEPKPAVSDNATKGASSKRKK